MDLNLELTDLPYEYACGQLIVILFISFFNTHDSITSNKTCWIGDKTQIIHIQLYIRCTIRVHATFVVCFFVMLLISF